jgi:hypothetical protein
MATQPLDRPPALAIARSAAGVYLRKVAATVAALWALFGGVQLAARTDSPLVVTLALTVLIGAGVELLFPGSVTRGTVPPRWSLIGAAVPIGLVWVALAVVIGSAGGAAIAAALVSLRALLMFCGFFMAIFVARGLYTRDPEILPVFRREQ